MASLADASVRGFALAAFHAFSIRVLGVLDLHIRATQVARRAVAKPIVGRLGVHRAGGEPDASGHDRGQPGRHGESQGVAGGGGTAVTEGGGWIAERPTTK